MRFLKVAHLSHAHDASDGGISMAVAALSQSQHAVGLKPQWLTSDSFAPHQRDRALLSDVVSTSPHVVHLHGLWRSPTRIARRLAGTGLPTVIAPHGMLDSGALAISRKKKQLVWQLWERRALRSARCIHALCAAEAESVRALLPKTPIAVIPNGVELPDPTFDDLPPPWADSIPPGDSVLLFFGRFHPKKGLDPLLKAWQQVAVEAAQAGWWLAFVGYGDDEALARSVVQSHHCGELERVLVFGPVFGVSKAAVLSAADAFVLPSFSEGLPMAALEAMAYGLPCVLSSACNLPMAFSVGAAVCGDPEPEALSVALRQFFRLTGPERSVMGVAGQLLVREHFSWQQVAAQTSELYEWILTGCAAPAFVDLG